MSVVVHCPNCGHVLRPEQLAEGICRRCGYWVPRPPSGVSCLPSVEH